MEEVQVIEIRECKFPRVPSLLRQQQRDAHVYDPLVVSFGPYHHGKPELQKAEKFKPRAAELFAEGSNKDVNYFYEGILANISDVQGYYEDDYDDAALAKMMLYDACFIINYMEIATLPNCRKMRTTGINLGMLVLANVRHDFICLENQIPLSIIKSLLALRHENDHTYAEKLISKFLNFSVFGEGNSPDQPVQGHDGDPPIHLLEAIHKMLVPKQGNHPYKHDEGSSQLRCRYFMPDNEYCVRDHIQSFRSVSYLKAKGIYFKPSVTNSLKDVKFRSSIIHGEIELPTWIFTNYTKVLFTNLVAYEMCAGTSNEYAVTSYIDFMKSLIENLEDIKELREKKILFNVLGSDQEVVDSYKEINTCGINNHHLFQEVKKEIERHINSRLKTWMVKLIHARFRNPWAFTALLAATLLLCLTFLQTYFTIHPS